MMDELRDCRSSTQSAGPGHETLFGRLGELHGILLSLRFGGRQSESKKACQSHVDHKYTSEGSGRLEVSERVGVSFSEPDQGVFYDPGGHELDETEWRKPEDMELVREDVGGGDTCSQKHLRA